MSFQRCQDLLVEAYDYINKGDYQNAINCFDEVLAYGEVPEIINDKGVCLNELNRFDEAIICFNRVIDLINDKSSKFYVMAWYNKGRSFIGLGKNEQALQCFNIVLDLDPTYENARIAINLIKND